MDQKMLHRLFSLLDDENDSVARSAMAELLKHPDELDSQLCLLHETPDPLLRKRIHQLDAILTLRRRRKNFVKLLKQPEIDLAGGLIEIHLMWYDNDSAPALADMTGDFAASAEDFQTDDIFKVRDFMRAEGFATPVDGETLSPDNYCVGSVLEDRTGSEILLCLLAMLAALAGGGDLRLGRLLDHFLLFDGRGNWLLPANGWETGRLSRGAAPEYWDSPRRILRYLAMQLFVSAVGSDSFRYIHTIASSLIGSDGTGTPPDDFPYPYQAEKADS